MLAPVTRLQRREPVPVASHKRISRCAIYAPSLMCSLQESPTVRTRNGNRRSRAGGAAALPPREVGGAADGRTRRAAPPADTGRAFATRGVHQHRRRRSMDRAAVEFPTVSRYLDTANRLLRAAGLEVRRKPAVLVRSSHDLPMTVEYAAAHLRAFNPGREFTVLQVGAYDGIANDPIATAIGAFGWKAVLVEPQRGPFIALQNRYRDNPQVQAFNVAISDQNGSRPLFTLEPSADLPDWTQQTASFNRSHFDKVQKHLAGVDISARVKAVDVSTWTFDTLFERSRVGRVDILQIDAEGYDFELLKMFDVPRRIPTIVSYEHQHLSRADRAAAAELLVKCGYRLAMVYGVGDTIAVAAPHL